MPTLALWDVDDTAAFVTAIVNRSGLSLSWSDREDLEQYLVVEAWRLSDRYRPGGISFSCWAGTTLRLRCVDWQRQRFGRTKWGAPHYIERPRPQSLSFDDLDDSDLLGGPVGAGGDDLEAGWSPGLARLLRAGDRQRDADLETLRRGPAGELQDELRGLAL